MEFEFDEAKSRRIKKECGLDFVEAQALWNDPDHIEVRARYMEEERWLVVGQIAGKHWTAVITYRGNNIRIISVRRSRKKEVRTYEEENQR